MKLCTRRSPAVSHLRTFGCVGHVKKVGGHLTKLADRSSAMVFVGYEAESKAYRMYDPLAKKLHISRDVVFEEERSWNWTTDVAREGMEGFAVEYTTHLDELYPSTHLQSWQKKAPEKWHHGSSEWVSWEVSNSSKPAHSIRDRSWAPARRFCHSCSRRRAIWASVRVTPQQMPPHHRARKGHPGIVLLRIC